MGIEYAVTEYKMCIKSIGEEKLQLSAWLPGIFIIVWFGIILYTHHYT